MPFPTVCWAQTSSKVGDGFARGDPRGDRARPPEGTTSSRPDAPGCRCEVGGTVQADRGRGIRAGGASHLPRALLRVGATLRYEPRATALADPVAHQGGARADHRPAAAPGPAVG